MANLSSIMCSVASSLDNSERLMVKWIAGRNGVFVGQFVLVRLKRQFSCTQTKALYQFLFETVGYLQAWPRR